MNLRKLLLGLTAASAVLVSGIAVWAQEKPKPQDYEKKVKEAEVPAPALAALKKLAGGAAFTEFAEEVEHGHKYYEGTWKGPDGSVDALVTEAGDVIEIEESMPGAKVPAGVRAAAEKAAGKDASFERKTVYMYEIHYKKDGKTHEMIFTADGRVFREEGGDEKKGDEKDEDEDD